MLFIVGLAWCIVGMLFGFFIATMRMIESDELQEKLADLRELRIEADRAKTIYHVAKMLERVNQNLLLDIFKQIEKDKENAKSQMSADRS